MGGVADGKNGRPLHIQVDILYGYRRVCVVSKVDIALVVIHDYEFRCDRIFRPKIAFPFPTSMRCVAGTIRSGGNRIRIEHGVWFV
jgi:hypothetical protein